MAIIRWSTKYFEETLEEAQDTDSFSLHPIANDHLKTRGYSHRERCRAPDKRQQLTTRETNFSLRSTLRLKRSLGGYSHREHCRAPDRTHSAKSDGLEDNSRSQRTRT